MIVKNGEILAIDHIAHDNTLSGNGTSAKPVGLSQSTKDLIDSKVNNDNFNAYKTEADGKFATKQNLTDTKAELESTIESVSGEIISKVNTDYGTLDSKIDAIANTLSNDYYTSLEIDAILAASGEYYTKTESDTKYTEKSVFETAINELSSNKLDKSATANWDVTEYTEGENIKIVDHEISGKDWSDEIAAAVENKVDKSELENYYTSDQIDDKFVTKTEFNDLDNEVGAIDADLDTLSGKTVTVIKDSETVKAIRSTEPDGTISYTLSAHDGKQADYLWKPTVNAAGDISWELALTGDTPDPANIKGPQGIQGISGTPGKNGENGITPKLKIDENDIWNVSYDNEETWTSLGVSATGPKGETGAQGPQGISGTPGKNGENGITPHIGNNNHWFIGDDDTGVSATGPQGPKGDKGDTGEQGPQGEAGAKGADGKDGVSPTVTVTNIPADPSDHDHQNGGTEITITDATSTNKFSAWNGNDGTMAGAPDIEGKNGISAVLAGSTYEVGLSGAFYNAITSVSSTYATKDALDDYLTKNDAAEAYQPKGEYLSANALNGYATESWVGKQGYLKQNDIAGKADKTELETVSGEIVNMIPSLNGYATEQYVQGASAEVTAWVNDQNYLIDSDLNNYATKAYAEEASANALSEAKTWVEGKNYLVANDIAGKADKTDLQYVSAGVDYVFGHIPIKVTDLTDSADYAKKTDLDGFVTSDGITTEGADYVMTTTGWKVLSLPGGGMTAVIHDTTLTGLGNDNNSKLGVAWSALSAYTITSALSAGSATVAANLGTSSFADITGAINAKADATAISDMLTKTEATSTYQPKGNYVTASDITDMATKTWVGDQGFLKNTDLTDYATKTYANEASANALSEAKTWVGQRGFITKDVDDLTYYYKKTETSSTSELSTEFAKKVNNPDTSLTDKYLVLRTDTNGAVSGWCNFNDKIYSKTESDGRYMQKNTDSTLSGDGTTNTPLGIDTTDMDDNKQYAFTTTGWEEVQGGGGGGETNIIESIRLEGDSADVTITNKKATIPLATASATGVAGNTGVITKDDKAHLDAAVEYKENPYDSSSPKALIPQQMFVCESDQQIIDIVTNHTDLINGKGTIFFRITGI